MILEWQKIIYKDRKDRIQCDVSVLNGKEDVITQEEIFEWKNYCDKGFNVYNFKDGHFLSTLVLK